ncbi:glycosyltransferase family 39 protein [Kitasatospora sp. CB02891]|uniref:glycosyltransferase family 39 protein n=1 Tax=Kitasatospora sp. CB02891 TaxID=2020329 RepID=UPI0018E2522F|nr:glycosyltransferase family 39 protein [Kitasatospora sp. CB02891]
MAGRPPTAAENGIATEDDVPVETDDRAPADPADESEPGSAAASGFRRALERFGPALALFGAVKLAGFAAFMWLLETNGHYLTNDPRFGGGAHPWDVLGSWDGLWYQKVAQLGYDPQLIPDQGFFTIKQNSAAFFPMYPGLIRLVSSTGLGLYGSGMLVSVVASFVAAAGIFAVVSRLYGHRAGVIAAGLWAAFPGSGVEWAVYSESVFVALAAWACYFVIDRNWLSAAVVTFMAGLARPSSVPLIAGVALAAAIALWKRSDGVAGPLTAIVLPPIGCLGYLGWVGYRMGHLDGYITLQRGGWLHFFDWGRYTLRAATNVLRGESNYLFTYPTEDLIAVLVLLALPILLVSLLSKRPPLVLTVYTVGTLVMVLGSQQMFGTLSRFVLPIFPLLIPLAVALARVRLRNLATVLGVAALSSGWFAGYVIFQLGIP